MKQFSLYCLQVSAPVISPGILGGN